MRSSFIPSLPPFTKPRPPALGGTGGKLQQTDVRPNLSLTLISVFPSGTLAPHGTHKGTNMEGGERDKNYLPKTIPSMHIKMENHFPFCPFAAFHRIGWT